MDPRMERIEDKLDKMVELQADMGASLREHMRRTELAELSIDEIAREIKPIQEHVAFIRGFSKLVTGLGAIVATLATLWQLIGKR